MKKNKGMKIYKQRKRKRGSDSQFFSILSTVAVVFGAGIFGYYVIAVPIHDLYTSMNDTEVVSDKAEVADSGIDSEQPSVTSSGNLFEDAYGDRNESKKEIKDETPVTESVPVTEKTEVTEAKSETAEPEVTSAAADTEEPAETQAKVQTQTQTVVKGGCLYLTVSDILDIDSLRSRLDSVEGCTSVAVPLKTTGGRVNYDSSVSTARLSGAIYSYLTLSEIVDAINEKGLTPVAELSTIADNIYPLTYKKSAYQFDDGVTGEWLDNKPENGGKPWVSPFQTDAQEYLCNLVDEITAAGIKTVICTDNYFPPFREKDLGYIGETVKSQTRYKGLTDLLNMLNSTAASNGGKVMLGVNASEVLSSSAEVFRPEELGSMSAVVNITAEDLQNDSLHSVLNRLEGMKGGMKIVPCIVTDGQSADAVNSSVSTLKSAGYELYMVK